MDFFAHQDAARKRTRLLLFYYVLAVAGLVVASYAVTMLALGTASTRTGAKLALWNPQIFACTTGLTLFIIIVGTLFRIMDLRDGGRAVAEMLGAEEVPLEPPDARERMLRNVVEEMAIASGVPVPAVFVMRNEQGINAFAAGYSEADAAVAVTRGCLEQLTREELQGVIAHEFSHILNGDMRLNIRLLAVLNGILGVYLVGRVLFEAGWSSSDSKRLGGALGLGGLLFMGIGGLGVFFSRLIQAAVSRQREFLADASAVQFTRDPNGIANALKKIGGFTQGSKLRSAQAEAISHMFFSNGLAEHWFELTATHPPLPERIKRLDPSFDGTWIVSRHAPALDQEFSAFAPSARSVPPLLPPRIPVGAILRHAGEPAQVFYAAGVLESLPAELRDAAHDPFSATALVFAFLLHAPGAGRDKQLMELRAAFPEQATAAEQFSELLPTVGAQARLPLLNLCLPAWRTLSHEQWQEFRAMLERLITSDEQVDFTEFVLRRIIERNVEAVWHPRDAAVMQFYSFNPLAPDCSLLLSALAWVGTNDSSEAQEAFAQGAARLPAHLSPEFYAREQCGIEHVDAALARLAASVPHIRKTMLEAAAHAVACDGVVNVHEAELLRAVAESLGCPIPPLVQGVSAAHANAKRAG
jgi:Zn-dependent protease with chaperone function